MWYNNYNFTSYLKYLHLLEDAWMDELCKTTEYETTRLLWYCAFEGFEVIWKELHVFFWMLLLYCSRIKLFLFKYFQWCRISNYAQPPEVIDIIIQYSWKHSYLSYHNTSILLYFIKYYELWYSTIINFEILITKGIQNSH